MSEPTRKVRPDRIGLSGRLYSDRKLASRISGGDPVALDEVFRRYHQPIYRFCSAMVGTEEAKDVLQNVMTKAMTSMPHDEDFQMKPWLYRVARNECVDHLRQARRTTPGFDPDSRPDDSGRRDPHRVAVDRERLGQLVDDLNDLPERQRATLVMRELSGLEYSEIAEAAGTTESAAKQLVYEARLSLEQADLGRKLDCLEVRESISSGDRRRLKGRKVRSHMRTCGECSAFESAIARRRAGLQSLFPVLPLGASAGLLDALHHGGAAAGTAAGTTAAAATGGTLIGGATTGVIAKGMAVLVVAGGIGVGASEVARHKDAARPVTNTPTVTSTDSTTPSGTEGASRASGPLPGVGGQDGPVRTGRTRGPERTGADRAIPARTPDRIRETGASGRSGEAITPGQGEGQGPASLPEAASTGQSRADQASSAAPGQTGGPPPSRKPDSPPGQSSGGSSGSGGTTSGNGGETGNSAQAPATGRPHSPGNSGK